MIESIIQTVIVVLTAVVLVVATFVVITYVYFKGIDQISYSIEFIGMVNEPYSLANVVMNTRFGDRLGIEHFAEIFITGSQKSSPDIEQRLKDFLNRFSFRQYSIKITDESKELLYIDKSEIKCGTDAEGVCVTKYTSDAEYCGVGRAEIDDSGLCSFGSVCCKEDIGEYKNKGKFDIVTCGTNDRGICNSVIYVTVMNVGTNILYECTEGLQVIDDNGKCSGANSGKTPVCCINKNENEISYAQSAAVPLLFKDKIGYILFSLKV